MKNFIIEDTEENLEALENIFPDRYRYMLGKTDETEVLIASVNHGVLYELEYWEPDSDFICAKDAVEGTLKDILEATNAIN